MYLYMRTLNLFFTCVHSCVSVSVCRVIGVQKRASDPLKLEWATWSLVGLGTGLWSSLRAVIALNHWEPSLQLCLEKINLIDCETLSVSFLLLNVYRHCSSVGCLSREFWDRLTFFPYFYVYSFSWMPEIFLPLKPIHVVEAYLDASFDIS